MYKKSGNPKIEELTKTYKDRSLKISRLSPPKRDDKKFCLWCNEVELKKKNQKYCSPECSLAIFAWANPQKENGLLPLLISQDWKCNACQYDYSPILEQLHEWMKSHNWKIPTVGKDDAIHYMKWFKNRILKPHSPEVDHIVPIFKGGRPLDSSNLQCLCFTCHKAKTKKDVSKPKKPKAPKKPKKGS